jgi:hypothetical protein
VCLNSVNQTVTRLINLCESELYISEDKKKNIRLSTLLVNSDGSPVLNL